MFRVPESMGGRQTRMCLEPERGKKKQRRDTEIYVKQCTNFMYVYTHSLFGCQGQNFKVFWKRSFSQLRVSQELTLRPGGERRERKAFFPSIFFFLSFFHEEKGLQVRSYNFGRSQTEILLLPASWESTCTDLSRGASWFPL